MNVILVLFMSFISVFVMGQSETFNYFDCVSEAGEMNDEIRDLKRERGFKMSEVNSGLICSECKRTKSQIEKEESIAFSQHLTRVRGKALQPSRADIEDARKKIKRKYDNKIQSLENRSQSVVDRCNQQRDEIKKRKKEEAERLRKEKEDERKRIKEEKEEKLRKTLEEERLKREEEQRKQEEIAERRRLELEQEYQEQLEITSSAINEGLNSALQEQTDGINSFLGETSDQFKSLAEQGIAKVESDISLSDLADKFGFTYDEVTNDFSSGFYEIHDMLKNAKRNIKSNINNLITHGDKLLESLNVFDYSIYEDWVKGDNLHPLDKPSKIPDRAKAGVSVKPDSDYEPDVTEAFFDF